MDATDFVLSLIDAFNGHVEGRTLLQRRAYFVSVLAGVDSAVGFVTHYGGPYSPAVDNSLTRLKSMELLSQSDIKSRVNSSGLEIKPYEYRLTNKGLKAAAAVKQRRRYGAVVSACHAVLKAGNPDQLILSIAAKAHFTLKKRGQEMLRRNIVHEAQKYNSTLKKTSLEAAVRFLVELKLDQRSNPD
jgi:hypothetical protein